MRELDLLIQHRFLEGMDIQFVRDLAECAKLVSFASGEFVLRQGASAKYFYLIRSGAVAVELFSSDGGPVVIQKLGKGDVLGWSWLIPPFQWRFDARALESTEAIELDGEVLKTAFEKFPAFGYAVLHRFVKVVADRLEAERLKLVNIYGVQS
jgi:CRP-like cAMP-binding protein